MYDHRGVFAYTIELWDMPTEAGIKNRKFIEWYQDHAHEEDLQILKWADENIGEGGYVAWYEFDHPQLGKVELGGWNEMYTWRNPPVSLVGAEAARNTPFALAMGDMLPRLVIHELKVSALGNGDYHINVVVENTGFLPTCTSMQGKNRKAMRPVRVEIELSEGVRLIDGKRRTELDHLEGRSNKLDVAAIWAASPTDNRGRAEWVVHAEPGSRVKVHVLSEQPTRASATSMTIKSACSIQRNLLLRTASAQSEPG
jgi:hypothetical protein